MANLLFPGLEGNPVPPAGRGWPLVPTGCDGLRVRRFLVGAMEQQMWFFGCDAACADGNLLVRYGFARYRREQHRGESSCYRFLWCPDPGQTVPVAQVDLHGWCAGLHPVGPGSPAGGFLYLRARNRLGWYDAPAPPAPGDHEDDPAARRSFRVLGRCPEAGFRRSAAHFLGWLEHYERWIEAACGPRYRQRCFERAPQPWLPPSDGRRWLARYRQDLFPPTFIL